MSKSIAFTHIGEFVKQLGFESTNDIRDIKITPSEVIVTTFHRDEDGRVHMSAPDADDVVLVEERISVQR